LQHSAEFEHASVGRTSSCRTIRVADQVQQSSGFVHELPAALQPPVEPPVPPTVEPPVPVFEPPVLVPAEPPAPTELPPFPVDPVVSPAVPASLPPQVTSTTLANTVTTPAKSIRWIM
jgi:hypothetical protein